MLKELAQSGQMFGFDESGGLISVQELLAKARGREVSFNEAIAYVLRSRKENFISKFKRYAHAHN